MARIIEVEKSECVYSTSKKPTGEVEYVVKNDWHCGGMVYDDLYEKEDVTRGTIYQRMPSYRCMTTIDGEYSKEESCRFCKGIYDMKDMHAVDVKEDMFVCFCDNDYSPTHKEFKRYLREVRRINKSK